MRLLIERQNRWTIELTFSNCEGNLGDHRLGAQAAAHPTATATPHLSESELKSDFYPPPGGPNQRSDQSQTCCLKTSHKRSIRKRIGRIFVPFSRSQPDCPQRTHHPEGHAGLAELQVPEDPQELEGLRTAWELDARTPGIPATSEIPAANDTHAPAAQSEVHHTGSRWSVAHSAPERKAPAANLPSPLTTNMVDLAWPGSNTTYAFMHGSMSPAVSPITAEVWMKYPEQPGQYMGEQCDSVTPYDVSGPHAVVSPAHSLQNLSGYMPLADGRAVYSPASSPTSTRRSSNAMMMSETFSGSHTPSVGSAGVPSPTRQGTCTSQEVLYHQFGGSPDPNSQAATHTLNSFTLMKSLPATGEFLTNLNGAGTDFEIIGNLAIWNRNQNPTLSAPCLNVPDAYASVTQKKGGLSMNLVQSCDEAPPKYSPGTRNSHFAWEHMASQIARVQSQVQAEVLYAKTKCPRGKHAPVRGKFKRGWSSPEENETPSCVPFFPPLPCDLCDQVFTGLYRKGNMKRHKRLKHTTCTGPNPDLACRECGQVYKRIDARKKHEWKKHRVLDTKPEKRRPKLPNFLVAD
ncbi:hypothetical protein K469DRAFT_683144 [Zopfia rhizophila CBS 207.26]|uniref:C2H2-type domain-containing protein n=1 Tax=Zopfia rhizophila CBS 207.26 TaxID=1314779 RepID=A0A6A6EIN5_9PEZI|nr:hypothetical protein K469DRAFT_683144 [Zopfia rhizophila CBS 207.26]